MHDLLEKPLGCTCFKLRKLTRAMSRLYDQHMATVGLKTTQYSLLVNAARAARPVAELADTLGMERTTLTRNLKPLLEAGFVVLMPGADSRQRIVTITPAGRAKVEQAYVVWRAAQTEFEKLMGRDAVRALNQQLETTMTQLGPLLEEAHHAHTE
ncbi:MarR family winged helix-turn-helix transcriptional regulator [Massilia sp. CF038]|uniref:MarR family winged helix-turn-helix transcriptional regulator n=1 Tax=Massilia sp. CF038 TaxID=1881045 RepID=UPI000911BC94|nr:MarR family winged helix-turn-helix transcriptional regulator [Massilia sp. CF038]SHG56560.1 DNA-binding transcriptional regulator, MarR family [Massilia sp. CF038]